MARLAGTSSVADLVEAVRRALLLDGVTLWHRDETTWHPDATSGSEAERTDDGDAGRSEPRARARRPAHPGRGAAPARRPTSRSSAARSDWRSSRPTPRGQTTSSVSTTFALRFSLLSPMTCGRRCRNQGLGDLAARGRDRLVGRRPRGVPRHDRRGDGPARRARRQPARHEPAPDRCAPGRGHPVGLDEIVPAALRSVGARRRRRSLSRSPRPCHASSPTPASSSARSRTSSPMRWYTAAARQSASSPARSTAVSTCAWSIVAPASPPTSATGCSSRSSGSATTLRARASASASQSPAASSRRWVARSRSRTPRAVV